MNTTVQESSAPTDASTVSHWAEVAHQWKQLGPPLRPSKPDTVIYQGAIEQWARTRSAPRALIMGVTPELCRLNWPEGTDLVAIDHTQAMIEVVWPGPRRAAICAEWTAMPLESGSRDIALCDGGFPILSYPDAYLAVVQELHRVLAPGGLCVLRLFVPPKERESPQAVFADLFSNRISSLNALKLRLWAAFHKDLETGVRLADVWSALHAAAPRLDDLAAQLDWTLEHLLPINAYRDNSTRYHLASAGELSRLFCERCGGFELKSIQVPEHEHGERCPIVVFRRTGPVPGE